MPEHPTLYGLLLCGGASRRMGVDKAALPEPTTGRPLARHLTQILKPYVEHTCYSVRPGQEIPGLDIPVDLRIEDHVKNQGPMGGILSAFNRKPDVAWLVLACDLPHLDTTTIQMLVRHRDPTRPFTAFWNAKKGYPEPLCTVYEPAAMSLLLAAQQNNQLSPRKVIENSNVSTIPLQNYHPLLNTNTPEEWNEAGGHPIPEELNSSS